MTARKRQEVVTSLGKEHAFALFAEGEAVGAVLRALLLQPRLTSFLAFREPVVEGLTPTQLQNIIHPTFLPYEPVRSRRVKPP